MRKPPTVTSTPAFRSSIPRRVRAQIVRRHPNGAKARVEYSIGRSVVGYRDFDADGELMLDCGLRNGRPHGTMYRLDTPGQVLSATPYRNGLEHGLARQWSDSGRLLGTYRMRNGTGVDLWWQETWTKPRRRYLAEVHFALEGRRHGHEWWLNEDQRSVFQERHFLKDDLHGIEREWDARGQLRRGFPKFFVHGKQVTRRTYERASANDASLPVYRPVDDRPERRFPPVVARRLGRKLPIRPGATRS